MPSNPNFCLLPGHPTRIGKRKRVTANCRDEVLAALRVLIERYGDRAFSRYEIHAEMVAAGTAYAELTAYSAMQRMKLPDPRLLGIHLEHIGREGFRLSDNQRCRVPSPAPTEKLSRITAPA